VREHAVSGAHPSAVDDPPRRAAAPSHPPAPAPRHRHTARNWLGALVSLVTIGGFVWWALRQDAPRIPTSASALATLALAVGVYAGATLIRGWRWHTLLRRAEVPHERADAYTLVPVGYMGNTILPARGGEVLRVLLLAGRSPARKREVAGGILAERLLDAVVLAGLFAVLSWIGIAGTPVGAAAGWIAAGGAVAVCVLGAIALRARRHPRLRGAAGRLKPVAAATARLLSPLGLLLAAVTAGLWLLEGVVFHLVGVALDLPIGWVDGLFLVVLASFFSLIPAGPAYAGTFDTAAVFGLKALSITGGAAVSFAILVRAVLFVPITIAGLVLVLARYGGVRTLRRAQEPAAPSGETRRSL
jgi:glycosyltransferase 2 family protein